MNRDSIQVNSHFIKNSLTDFNGRLYFDYVVLTIHNSTSEYQGNNLCWLEENIINNIESAQSMPLVAQFLDNNTKDEPLGHGYVTRRNGETVIIDSEQIGSVVKAEIKDVEVDGNIIKALVATAYINEIRYPYLCQWVRANMFEGKSISTSVEIFSKKGNDSIISDIISNSDGEEIQVPKEFDFGGSAILTVEPADENAIVLEILNSKNLIDKHIKEVEQMEELQLQLNAANEKIVELEAKLDLSEKVEECTGEDECKCAKCKEAELEASKEKCNNLEQSVSELEIKVNSLEEEKTSLEEVKTSLQEANDKLSEYKEEKEKEILIKDFEESISEYDDTLISEIKDEIADFKAEPTAEKSESIINSLNSRFVKKAKEDNILNSKKTDDEKVKINSLFVEINNVEENKDDKKELKIWND